MSKALYSDDQKKLVIKLKQTRISIGLSQKQVAKMLGVTQSNISKIESGQLLLNVFQLKKIAKIYKKNVSFFIRSS